MMHLGTLPCAACAGSMRRSRRSFSERLLYVAAYRCERCRQRVRVSYLDAIREAKYAACPKCGWYDLVIRSKRDQIDKMKQNPLRLLQRLFGGRLYHCRHCRLQFYDLRPLYRTEGAPNRSANRMVGSESES